MVVHNVSSRDLRLTLATWPNLMAGDEPLDGHDAGPSRPVCVGAHDPQAFLESIGSFLNPVAAASPGLVCSSVR